MVANLGKLKFVDRCVSCWNTENMFVVLRKPDLTVFIVARNPKRTQTPLRSKSGSGRSEVIFHPIHRNQLKTRNRNNSHRYIKKILDNLSDLRNLTFKSTYAPLSKTITVKSNTILLPRGNLPHCFLHPTRSLDCRRRATKVKH